MTSAPDNSGNGTVLTTYELKRKKWSKVREWTQAGSVSRVLVGNDGTHFVALGADGYVTSYDTSKKAAGTRAISAEIG